MCVCVPVCTHAWVWGGGIFYFSHIFALERHTFCPQIHLKLLLLHSIVSERLHRQNSHSLKFISSSYTHKYNVNYNLIKQQHLWVCCKAPVQLYFMSDRPPARHVKESFLSIPVSISYSVQWHENQSVVNWRCQSTVQTTMTEWLQYLSRLDRHTSAISSFNQCLFTSTRWASDEEEKGQKEEEGGGGGGGGTKTITWKVNNDFWIFFLSKHTNV